MSTPVINKHLPLDKAELIAFFFEAVLYGVSCLLYILTVWVLIHRRKSDRLNTRLLVISSLLAFFSTFHIAVDLTRVLEGFIYHRDQPGGPTGYFGRLFDWSFLLKNSIFVIQTAMADSFASYRCYVVWNRWWILIGPVILVLSTLTAGIGVVYSCGILKPGEDVFVSSLIGWITAFFTLTLATNLTCTTLIASRIWFTTRRVSRLPGQTTLLPIIIIIVESGTIYSLACITCLVIYLLGSNAQYIALDGTFPTISITFNLIIVRIALGISHGATSTAQTTQNRGITSHGYGGGRGPPVRQGPFSAKPLELTITKVKEESSVHIPEPRGQTGVGARGADTDMDGDSESFTLGKEQGRWNAV